MSGPGPKREDARRCLCVREAAVSPRGVIRPVAPLRPAVLQTVGKTDACGRFRVVGLSESAVVTSTQAVSCAPRSNQ